MTLQNVPETDLDYYLISYDKKGRERGDDPDAPDGRLSEVVLDVLADEPITDVFFVSHGWKGDVPAAIRQYDAWIGAMARCEEDRQRIRQLRPGWRSLMVGLHWPSRPWGDEEQSAEAVSFGAPGADPIAGLVDDAADKIADTDRAREALGTVFAAAMDDISPSTLPPAVADAFNVLVEEAELASDGPAGAPGEDAESFDPERAYQAGLEDEAVSFGGGGPLGGILSVLRQLSFWKMKKRARTFGEAGAATLLRDMQSRVSADRDVRFHLMGHSFGCIVVSATIAGAGGDQPLVKPVSSACLVQGALSYWAYCSDIPVAPGKSGYFHSIARVGKVAGPIITTQSEHDTAVNKIYPLAAGLKRQVSFAVGPGEAPKYGALGAFGARGPGVDIVDREMPAEDLGFSYGFQPGKVYNLESNNVINEGGGLTGAHNDIAKPEVAHAFWEAIITASQP